tara:strand:+ start:1301 stop:1684 length:384 start_codon:yes stop_codon:yes gene_type:complete
MNWKETYTKIFLKQAEIAISEASLKQYMPTWWQNTRDKSEGGLRLTSDGFEFITDKLELQVYEVPFPKDFKLTTQTVIFLDKFINCPYYLAPYSLFVTNEKKALELHLFSGDLRKYGLNKAIQRQEK